MTLDELIRLVDQLDPEELQQLEEHVVKRRRETAEARADALMEAVNRLREGLTKEQIEEMAQAMNAEYIEPPEDDA